MAMLTDIVKRIENNEGQEIDFYRKQFIEKFYKDVEIDLLPAKEKLQSAYDLVSISLEEENFDLAAKYFNKSILAKKDYELFANAAADKTIKNYEDRLVNGIDVEMLKFVEEQENFEKEKQNSIKRLN